MSNRRQTTVALLAICLASAPALVRADWNAGRDMAANENGALELTNPNGSVPAWSYGYRATLASPLLNLFVAADHFNGSNGHPELQGWTFANSVAAYVNAGLTPITTNFGFGDNTPVPSHDMILHPSANNDYAVVRFTAQFPGTFAVSASWFDIDPHGGNGASADVILNGSISLFSQVFNNGGSTSLPIQPVTLLPGDRLEFLLGSRGDNGFDSTDFNATITLLPEPSVAGLTIVAFAAGARRRRPA